MTAVILAGGFGTRLRPRVSDRPKALAPVGKRPFLDFQLDWLADQGIRSVRVAAHHMAEQIEAYVTGLAPRGMSIRVVHEATPLGTGGAVANALRVFDISGPVLVINGDTHYDFELGPVLDTHRRHAGEATVVVAPVDDVSRYGTVTIDGDRVAGFRQAPGERVSGLVSCGVYVIEAELMLPEAGAFSLERDFFPGLAEEGRLFAHVQQAGGTFFDIGTPESYDDFRANLGE